MNDGISVWEGEGGSSPKEFAHELTGTINQIAWAEQIMTQVDAEFDRVANALNKVALRQAAAARTDTLAMIAILYEKRREVMAHQDAGYFIHDWQELRDQVRQMVMSDGRYRRLHPVPQ